MAKINVQNTEITIVSHNDDDYISLTDMARSQLQEHIIFRWLSLKSTIEYLGEWEMLYNPNFNCTEFGTFRNMAGSNNFVLSVKTWMRQFGIRLEQRELFRVLNTIPLNSLRFVIEETIGSKCSDEVH